MTKEAATTEKSAIAIRISVRKQIGDKCAMDFETFVDHSTPKDVVNSLTDMLMDVADRQTLKYELIDLRLYQKRVLNELETMTDELARHSQENVVNVEGRRNPVLKRADTTAVSNLRTSIESRKKLLKQLASDVTEREEKIT